MKKDEIFEIETRKSIYNLIKDTPGLHFREISRRLAIPKSTLNYHLRYLKKRDLIELRQENRFKRYYARKKIGKFEKNILNLIRQETPRKILLSMKIYHPVTVKYLSRDIERAPSTIKFHLKKLIEANIVVRLDYDFDVKYGLKDEIRLYDCFIQYNEGLLDDSVKDLINWITRIRSDISFADLIHYIQYTDSLIKGLYAIFPHPYHA